MAFTDKELNKKIDSFLTRACAGGVLGISKKIDLQTLLEERDPDDGNAVRETLKQQKKRLVAWLGITRKTTAEGAAGSIDNLLVLINSFVLLFVIIALVPVLFIYRDKTWIIPVALFCPIVHFFAFRLARNPEVSPSRTKNMHLFSAVVSIVPLLCLADFVAGIVRQAGFGHYLMAAAGALWIVHLLLVAVLIRTEGGFYWSLFLSDIVVSVGLLRIGRDFAGAVCLQLLLAMFLYSLAGWARSGKSAMSPARLHECAGVFLGLGFISLGILLISGTPLVKSYFVTGLVLYAAALAFLPLAIQSEDARLSSKLVRNGWKAMLAVTWLFFGLALLARGAFGVQGLQVIGGEVPRAPLYVFLIVMLAWSLLLLYEQFLATSEFDTNIFTIASLVLLGCLVAGYGVLALKVAHLLALLLAVGVFVVTMRLHGYYAAVFPPEPKHHLPPAPEEDNVDEPESTGEDLENFEEEVGESEFEEPDDSWWDEEDEEQPEKGGR